MKTKQALILAFAVLAGCGSPSIKIELSGQDELSIANSASPVQWICFRADYWHAPFARATSTETYFKPDKVSTGWFLIKGSIPTGNSLAVKYDLYKSNMFARYSPQNHPPGIMLGSIRSISYGNGTPPKPPASLSYEIADIFTIEIK